MKCFQMLTAIAVLAGASAAWADNLPPVPKVVTLPVSAVIVPRVDPAPEPTKAEARTEAKFKLTEKEAPLPSTCGQATSMPSLCGPVAPMPPVPTQTEAERFSCTVTAAKEDLKGQAKTCGHAFEKSVKFVTNEFLRKPIYDVQKALNDLEGRRLSSEDRRLNAEADRLACRSAELAEKAKQTCPCDLRAKLRLLKAESEYAKKANKLAVKQAALECKEADHQQQTEKLKAKHAKLFHDCD